MDIPHVNGVCRSSPCGIYATKEAETEASWIKTHGPAALGLVALSGKVVEHERGYKAARAEVVALAIEGVGDLITADNPAEIDRLLQQRYQWETTWEWPKGAICVLPSSRPMNQASAYIKEQAGRPGLWTLASGSE